MNTSNLTTTAMVSYVEESEPLNSKETPIYCPLCGRKLEGFVWVVAGGEAFYPSLVCYNGMSRWLINIKKWFAVTSPDGAHYQFKFPRQTPPPVVERFDRTTGKPKGE